MHSELLDKIDETFGLSDLKALTFELEIDFDNLGGIPKKDKIISLIKHCERRDMLPRLVNFLQKNRPHIKWDEVASITYTDEDDNELHQAFSNYLMRIQQIFPYPYQHQNPNERIPQPYPDESVNNFLQGCSQDFFRNVQVPPRQVHIYRSLKVQALTELDRLNILNFIDLSEIDLSNSFVKYTNPLNLSGAHLPGSNLSYASLPFTNFAYANLNRANLYRVELAGSNLSGANLDGANLDYAYLKNVKLNRTSISPKYVLIWGLSTYGWEFIGKNRRNGNLLLDYANLSYVNLDNAQLKGARLTGTNLYKASLNASDLRNANFNKAYLSQTKLEGADLRGACFHEAILDYANIKNAILHWSDLLPDFFPSNIIRNFYLKDKTKLFDTATINWTVFPNGQIFDPHSTDSWENLL